MVTSSQTVNFSAIPGIDVTNDYVRSYGITLGSSWNDTSVDSEATNRIKQVTYQVSGPENFSQEVTLDAGKTEELAVPGADDYTVRQVSYTLAGGNVRILALSTCEDAKTNGRLVVFGVVHERNLTPEQKEQLQARIDSGEGLDAGTGGTVGGQRRAPGRRCRDLRR